MTQWLLVYLIPGLALWLLAEVAEPTRHGYRNLTADGSSISVARFAVVVGTIGMIALWPITVIVIVTQTIQELRRRA